MPQDLNVLGKFERSHGEIATSILSPAGTGLVAVVENIGASGRPEMVIKFSMRFDSKLHGEELFQWGIDNGYRPFEIPKEEFTILYCAIPVERAIYAAGHLGPGTCFNFANVPTLSKVFLDPAREIVARSNALYNSLKL